MNGKSSWFVVALSFFAGLAGGMVFNLLIAPKPINAQKGQTFPKTLRAERLELVDKHGGVRAVLEVLPSGEPRLLLGEVATGDLRRQGFRLSSEMLSFGNAGEAVTVGRLVSGDYGLSVVKVDSGMIVVRQDGLRISDKWDDLRVLLSTFADNTAALTLYDRGKKARVGLMVMDSGDGALGVWNRNDNTLWSIP